MFGTMTPDSPPATFEVPGPGSWEYDRSHCPPAPTLLFRRVASQSMETAYRTVFEQYGAPLLSFGVTFVHGKMYRRLIPLIGGDKTGPTPPKPVLWLATRLHPAFRRREKLARKAITERNYLDAVDHWKTEREEWIAKNRALQSVDFAGLDDLGLADHVVAVDRHQHGRLAPASRVCTAATSGRSVTCSPTRPSGASIRPRSCSCSKARRRRRPKAPSAGGGSPTRCATPVSIR